MTSLQKESEWDEEFDELTKSMDGQFRPKLRLLFRKAITTAVSKRDAYFVEEVRKKATISEIAVSNIEVKPVKLVRLDDVLSILKH